MAVSESENARIILAGMSDDEAAQVEQILTDGGINAEVIRRAR